MKKTFLLGVGAQKAGTTWLYEALKNSSLFQQGFCKEYHVFDGLTTNPIKRQLIARDLFAYLNTDSKLANSKKSESILWKSLFYENVDAYFDYFQILSANNPAKKLFADITPAYSSLDISTLKFIKTNLENRGFNVKCLFLVREPLDRAWSAARYYYSRRFELLKEISSSNDHLNYFIQNYNQKKFLMRGRYDRTITNCHSIFQSNFKCMFFENLFNKEAISELSKFIGIQEFKTELHSKINEGLHKKNSSAYSYIPKIIIDDFLDKYRQVYDFMYQHYPQKTNKYWNNYAQYKLKA